MRVTGTGLGFVVLALLVGCAFPAPRPAARDNGLIDRLYASIDERSQASTLAEMGEAMASELPVVPLFFRSAYVVVRTGVHALADDYRDTRWTGSLARNAHLWSREG